MADGPVAIVTGAGGGIGRAVARRFGKAGVLVAGFDSAKDSMGARTAGFVGYVVDVADEDTVDDAFRDVIARFGRLDFLVCAAGRFVWKPFRQTEPSDLTSMIGTNLRGSFLCARAAARHMVCQRSGSIVLVASMLARRGGTNSAAYAASKGGILGLARSLALEVAAAGIRVNTVSPGLTDTAQPRGHMSEGELRQRARALPMGRMATADEVAEACWFLASEDASYLTGQDLRVDGAAHLW